MSGEGVLFFFSGITARTGVWSVWSVWSGDCSTRFLCLFPMKVSDGLFFPDSALDGIQFFFAFHLMGVHSADTFSTSGLLG